MAGWLLAGRVVGSRGATSATRAIAVKVVVFSNSIGWSWQQGRQVSNLCKEEELVTFRTWHNGVVGQLELNSPLTHNALTMEMGRQFESHVENLCRALQSSPSKDDDDKDDELRNVQVLLLTGAGGGAFCAGGDLAWLTALGRRSVAQNVDEMRRFYHAFVGRLRQVPIPTVAVLHGPAMGAGACLALACDVRLASKTQAKMGFPFLQLGFPSAMGALHFLPQLVGTARATQVLLHSETFTAPKALQVGLVHELIHDDDHQEDKEFVWKQAVERALEMTTVRNAHPLAVRLLTQQLRQDQNVGLWECLEREAQAHAICMTRNDWGEGYAAFRDGKRQPQYDPYHHD